MKHLYSNKLGNDFFAHNAAYFDSKDIARRTNSDKILKDRGYEIARNGKYDGYQGTLASMVFKFFDKETGAGVSVNKQLDLHKSVLKKFKRRKIYAGFKDNIWTADLAEVGSLSSTNKTVKYLLYAIDALTEYAWVKPLKDKKGKTVLNAFIEIVKESYCKPNKLLVDPGREFFN